MKLQGLSARCRIETAAKLIANMQADFGMCSGLILTDYNFHIRRTAEAYLVGRSQKWDHALAVKYDTSEGQNWLIGAWCAERPRAP